MLRLPMCILQRLPLRKIPKFWLIFLVCKFMFFMKSSLHVFFHFSQTGTVFFICLASSFSSLIESGGFLILFSWLSFSESKLIFIFFVEFFFLIRNICTVLFHLFTKHAKKKKHLMYEPPPIVVVIVILKSKLFDFRTTTAKR